MGVGGNSALTKNSTDGILNLLQLSLLGNNAGVNAGAGAPTSNISNLNSSIVPNSNSIMAAKANFYPQSVGANLSGIGVGSIASGVLPQQSIMPQPVSYIRTFYVEKKKSIFIARIYFYILTHVYHFFTDSFTADCQNW